MPTHAPATTQAAMPARTLHGATLRGIAGRVADALRRALGARCLACAEPCRGDGPGLCAACLRALPFNHAPCPRCALPGGALACTACAREGTWPFAQARAPLRYAPPLDRLLPALKFRDDLAALRTLALLAGPLLEADPGAGDDAVLVPVPLHPARLRQRGHDQARLLAAALARGGGRVLRPDLLRRVRATGAQTGLGAAARRANLAGAFAVTRPPPPRVIVLDDVMSTGASLAAAAQALREAGCQTVTAWAIARTPAPAT
jgi:ComF family protein